MILCLYNLQSSLGITHSVSTSFHSVLANVQGSSTSNRLDFILPRYSATLIPALQHWRATSCSSDQRYFGSIYPVNGRSAVQHITPDVAKLSTPWEGVIGHSDSWWGEWHSCCDASHVGSSQHNPMKISTAYLSTRGSTKPMRLLQRWFCGELSWGWQADCHACQRDLQLRQSLQTTKTDRHVTLARFIYPIWWPGSAQCPRFHWQVRVSVMSASSFLSLYLVLG